MPSSEAAIGDLQGGDSEGAGTVERGLRERLRWVIVFVVIEAILIAIALLIDVLAGIAGGLASDVLSISSGILGAFTVITGVIGVLLLVSVYVYFAIRSASRDEPTSY